MRAYLYFTWDDVEDGSGFSMLKQAMLHDVSDHIHQLGNKGFFFLTERDYETVSRAIKEKQGRPFILIDITEGLNANQFSTTIDVEGIRGRFTSDTISLTVNDILDKMLNKGGYASLSKEERDYLDSMSKS